MMATSIDGATQIFGDAMSVINNTSKPECALKKKNNAVCYHEVQESIAMGESFTKYIGGNENPADLMTKIFGVEGKQGSRITD